MWLPDATSGSQLFDWLSKGGAVGVLAAAVVAFLRGWVVTGALYRQVRSERDKALELVYKQAEIAQRALEVGEIVQKRQRPR